MLACPYDQDVCMKSATVRIIHNAVMRQLRTDQLIAKFGRSIDIFGPH
jgi:hypothetical protein